MRKLSVYLLAATANALLCTPGVRHSPRIANFSPVMQFESDSDAAALSAQRELSTALSKACLLYTSPSPRDGLLSRMPSSA